MTTSQTTTTKQTNDVAITKDGHDVLVDVPTTLDGDSAFLETFYTLFKGRTNQIALGSGEFSISVSSEDDIRTRVAQHLAGIRRLGFYNLLPDLTSSWAVIDCDDHDGRNPDAAKQSLEILTHLRSHGIAALRERSKNVNGSSYHVWIFFEQPANAGKLKNGLTIFLTRTLGINPEVFPKGSKDDSLGNFVWLPLFGGTDTLKGNVGQGIHEGRTVFIDEQGNPYADQQSIVEGVPRNTEAAFDSFLAAYNIVLSAPVVVPLQKKKQNSDDTPTADLAKVRECPFMKYCEDNAETLAEPLWYAWITNAIRCIGGRDYIHEYSSKYKSYSKEETNDKIAHALADTGPMTHEAIAELGYTCTCLKKFKAPISRSYYRDVDEEIKRIQAINDASEQVDQLKSLIGYIRRLDPLEQDIFEERIKTAFKLKARSFKLLDEELITPENVDFEQPLVGILEALISANVDDTRRARVVFRWFKENQTAAYFTDETEQHYIYHQRKLIPMVESSADFAGLLLYHGNISLATQMGRVTVQVMNAMAQLEGKRIKKNTWLETDQAGLAIYLNLKNERQELLKITPKAVELIQNGDNTDNVFMLNTHEDKLEAISYERLGDDKLKGALLDAANLIVRHIPCSEHERWFTFGWWMSIPLYDFTRMHLITRAQGKAGQGKTTACDVLTTALYGKAYTDKSTVASLYSDASINPLVVDDNLESRNFYGEQGRSDFYLGAATGGGKQKRDVSAGTSGMVIERVRALVLSNGIESIARSEQTSRMMIIECNKDLYGSNYTSAVLLDIKRKRDVILSGIFQMTGRVLRRMQDGDWQKVQEKLQTEYKDHPKSRMFEHVALIILCLEEYFAAVGKTADDVWKLVEAWMRSQKESAIDEILETNPIVEALDLIRDASWKQQAYDKVHLSSEPADKIERSRIIKLDVKSLSAEVSYANSFQISGTAGNLLSAFAQAVKTLGARDFQVNTAKVLTQRIAMIEKELETHGYFLEKEFDSHKKQWIYKFSWKSGDILQEAA